MTPAKLLALSEARGEYLELLSRPVDRLAWYTVNLARDPGERDEHGNVTRQPAEVIAMKEFRTLYTRRRLLATNNSDKYDHNIHGAIADRSSWAALVESKQHK